MSLFYITYDTPTIINIRLTNLVENQNTFAEITDVLYYFKHNANDKDTNAVLSKSLGSGITLDSGNEKIVVTIAKADFGLDKIEKRKVYLVCLAVEFNSSGNYIEDYDPQVDRKVEILPDKIRA